MGTTLIHEVGHRFGLGHNVVGDATFMTPGRKIRRFSEAEAQKIVSKSGLSDTAAERAVEALMETDTRCEEAFINADAIR